MQSWYWPVNLSAADEDTGLDTRCERLEQEPPVT